MLSINIQGKNRQAGIEANKETNNHLFYLKRVIDSVSHANSHTLTVTELVTVSHSVKQTVTP